MCTKATDDRGARDDLETVITKIGGLATVLAEMGKHRDGEAAAYLAGVLQDHYEEADDAFARIFGLGEYAERRPQAAGKVQMLHNPGGPDAALFALFAEYERVYDRTNELQEQGLSKQAQACSECAAALEEQIEAVRPATIPGALKMLERGLQLGRDLDPPDSHSMLQQALAGLREIAEREPQR